MMLNRTRTFLGVVVLLVCAAACQTHQRQITATGEMIPMTAKWDSVSNQTVDNVVLPYKQKVDSIMSPVIGVSALDLTKGRPESLLSNFAADMLRNAVTPYLGKPADMALMNMGGLRAALNAGPITVGEIFEVFPFQNTLCLVYLKGKDLKHLMENIASVGGEGVSNVRIHIGKDRNLISATIGGKPIDEQKVYTVATIDYLVEGNDKMIALRSAEKIDYLDHVTLRDLFLSHIKALTAAGKEVTAKLDGRIQIDK